MRIETISEWALTPDREAGIADLLVRAFGPEFGGRSFYRQRHHLRIVALHSNLIVGHVALLMREIRLGSRLTPIIGLAEVATHPDRRGEGIASALLAEVIRVSRASPAKFLVLFGDRPLYAGHGFVRANNTLTYTRLDDARTHGIATRVDKGLMILPLTDDRWDFAAPVDLLGHLF